MSFLKLGSSAINCCIWALHFCAADAIAQPAPDANAPQSSQARTQALHRVFADYWEDHLRHAPEEATAWGDKRFNDRWTEYSAAAINSALLRGREFARRLRSIDASDLAEQDRLSSALLLHNLAEQEESVHFKEWEMPVTQIHGPDIDMPQLVGIIPFEDVHDYENYISRLHRLPAVFDQLIANMKLGVREGRVPARLVAEKVLTQLRDLAAYAPIDSPFSQPLKRFPENISSIEQKRLAQTIHEAIEKEVNPAYRRFAAFIESQYLPKTRERPGVDSIPDGAAYYAFCIRRSTTLDKSADEIHRIGLEEVARDEEAMRAIASKLGFADLQSFNAAIKSDPKRHPASTEQLLDMYRGFLAQMHAKLPQLFGTLPKADLVVEATPAYAARQKPAASYDEGTSDGKRPGRVVVNTFNLADIQLGDAESIAYHEGIPGHHLQISIAQELDGLPEFRKQYANTAYLEGWALYSERLGKDVGFYQDSYSDYGRLQGDIWRAIRLVVDTGIHSKHWTRQQVVDFFHEHSSVDETNVQRETDRYIAWPGQALGYKIGQLKLLDLRQRAQAALGAKFDLKEFHDLILDSGALPLDVLDQRVNKWLATKH